jgi:hypothetical protein
MRYFLLLLLVVWSGPGAWAQPGGRVITGLVTDEAGAPLELVTVALEGTSYGAVTNPQGAYQLRLPADLERGTLVFNSLGFKLLRKSLPATGTVVDVTMRTGGGYEIEEVVKRDDRKRYETGTIYLDPSISRQLPSTIGGIEGLIKTFVGSNNELTSQYSVRGGNYDENLVYVNDFEIYRPYLTRSGQQEGLSFVNPDLVSGVNFSLGGFAARYGDKMSSVLDVSYRRPKKFGGSVDLSFLGAAAHLEGISGNKKLTYLVGLRQKSNQYLLQAQPTKGVYNPTFTDVQALVNYRINNKWEVEAIGNYARNRFSFQPEEATSAFGLINQAFQLRVFYEGNEIDQFDSRFGGVSTTFRPNEKTSLKLLASAFQTDERETYDIGGEYVLGELETDLGKENFGNIKYALGTGIIQNYARNYLKVAVRTLAHRGSYSAGKHFIQWGADLTYSSVNDRLQEWERRDSAGYTQPYDPDVLRMRYLYQSSASFDYLKTSVFVQDNFRPFDSLDFTANVGVRYTYNGLNGESFVSPRVQLAYKPRGSRNIVYKAAAGMYAQPAFYREMRSLAGDVNTQLRAQKSAHYLLGADYNFKAGTKPMKLTAEMYYKQLWDLVPYEYDNVRIRYFGKNDAEGYAYGGEVRLYGELVKDAPSWISLGLLKTAEDILDDRAPIRGADGQDSAYFSPGYIPRPSDQRFMLSMYFQDYLPRNKNFRMHLNLMYSSGLPFGPPDGRRYGDTLRLPDYKRVDIGFSGLLLDGAKKNRPSHSFFRQFESIWASVEVFNLLGIQNTLSYSYIQDQTSGNSFAVPNRLTTRLLNVKLAFRF